MSYKIKGRVSRVLDTQQINEKFSKREVVLTIDDDGKYPQTISLETVNEKTSYLDGINPGDMIEVDFNLRGREWTKPDTGEVKVFNTLSAFQIKVLTPAAAPVDDGLPF